MTYPVDVWTLAARNIGGGSVNGDGWLVYPGRDYGVYGPIGTIRLENIREGLEEYEYLKQLDEQLAPLGSYYNQPDMKANTVLRSYLDTLYTGTWATTNTSFMVKARDAAANAIVWARDYNIISGEMRKSRDYVELDIFLPGGATINTAALAAGTTVEKTENAGSGKKVTFRVERAVNSDTMLNFSFTQNGNFLQCSKYLDAGRSILVAFDDENARNYVGVSRDSTITTNSQIGGVNAYKFDLVSSDNELEIMTFRPYITLNSSFLALLSSDIGTLTFKFYNSGTEDITITISRRTSTMEAVDMTVTLSAGQWTQVAMPLVGMSDVLLYRIYFPNKVVNKVAKLQTVYLSKIYKGE